MKSPIIGYEPKLSFFTFKHVKFYVLTLSRSIFLIWIHKHSWDDR